MKKPKPIQPFSTLKQEANFWDTHDVSALFASKKSSPDKLPILEKEKDALLTIRVQSSVKKKLETLARAKGISASTLSRMWLIEKLQTPSA